MTVGSVIESGGLMLDTLDEVEALSSLENAIVSDWDADFELGMDEDEETPDLVVDTESDTLSERDMLAAP